MGPAPTIEPCCEDEIRHMIRLAGSEIVRGSSRNVEWFRVGEKAFAGLRRLTGNRARLVNCWVAPEHRGRGVGLALVAHRIERARALGAAVVDTRARRPETFERLGFTRGRSYRCGVTHCELRLSPS